MTAAAASIAPTRVALVGAPNCGKSTLFNGLTGGRAKVANYPGATVETRHGRFTTPAGRNVDLIDLPGFYGMSPRSLDERVALETVLGKSGAAPELILALVDAATLRTHLQSVLQLRAIGAPMIVVLNMFDLATRDGLEIDIARLEKELGLPVVTTNATRKAGREALLARLDAALAQKDVAAPPPGPFPDPEDVRAHQIEARRISSAAITYEPPFNRATRAIDRVVLHPVAGPVILAGLLFTMFQMVYTWSAGPVDMLDAGAGALGEFVAAHLPAGWLRDLIVDGIIAGVGSVVVFLPQIIILFTFILLLEASGYMARAAFLMDEIMHRFGLNGRAFIPLLSSFACAIPGIMASRVIENDRDRLTTILIAPLMTCSARLPVYALIIGAFIPEEKVGLFNLQGLVLFALYITGIISAVLIAFIFKRTIAKARSQPLIMELPTYKLPNAKDFFISLWIRAAAFLKRAGTVILTTSIILWFLAAYPASATSLRESYAGRLGSLIEPLLAPIGFNLEIAIALVPGMAAREVAVGALGTVYAIHGGPENAQGLSETLQSAWSLPTALAFLAWYVFAPQCFATLATIRRETGSWKWAGFALGYLFTLAYTGAGLTYWISRAAGL
ncbi:ferrous iron transport protein B [Hyphococcus sp.]|uniref:ferrous iron transport protein B n=1 Tax=Hyphococcus sp. TaxID=2038636 RepID=UPI0035C783B5